MIPVVTDAVRPTSQDRMATKRRADNEHMMHGIATKHRAVAESSHNDQHVPSASTSHGTAAGNEC